MSDKEEKEIDVRIIPNRKDKRKFKKVHLKIPQVKEVSVMKEMLLNICGKDFANGNPTNVEIGYIGYSNRKYQIQNEKELLKGFESWQEHATECPLFYIVEAEAKPEVLELDSDSDNCIPASKKQKKEDTNKTTKRKKAASREAKKEEIVSNLEEKHGTQWEKREYRLWAEAIKRPINE
ncbi:hypothetical protein AC249_AIPGENE22974 [Exaiptasia diaphana]|nr:hypothetical protein AC249_AIPGENE22974 [Exaiptasia diaphana]